MCSVLRSARDFTAGGVFLFLISLTHQLRGCPIPALFARAANKKNARHEPNQPQRRRTERPRYIIPVSGAKAPCVLGRLRGAEAPLFHGEVGVVGCVSKEQNPHYVSE